MTGPDSEEDALAALENPDHVWTIADRDRIARCLADASKQVRLRAASALSAAFLSNHTPPGFAGPLLDSENLEVRWGAAYACSKAGIAEVRIFDIAVEVLDMEDGDVRWAAASIVTREARDSDALRGRLRSLVAADSPRLRKMAILCLCDSGERDGALYRGSLGDEDPFVRLAALTSLARSGDRSGQSLAAVKAVSESDDDVRVRRGAVAILARLGGERSQGE